MVESDYLQKQLQNSMHKLNANTQHVKPNYVQAQDNIRQAALQKVDQVMSRLQFPSGQKIDIKLNPSQQAQLNNTKQVDVSLEQQALKVSPTKMPVAKYTLTPNQLNQLTQYATTHLESNQTKGHLVTAQVKQSQAVFHFEQKQYQLPLPKALTQLKQIALMIKPDNNQAQNKQLNIAIVNQPKYQNLSLQAQAKSFNGDTYVVKNILIEPSGISFKLANTPIKLPLDNLTLSQSNAIHTWQLANLTIKGNQGELQLANNESISFKLPVKQMAQQALEHLSQTPKKLFELLAIKNPTLNLPIKPNEQLQFSLQNKTALPTTELVILLDKSISINIKLSDALQNQLIASQLFQLKSAPAQTVRQNEISPAALLKQLNQLTEHKQMLSQSQIQQIKQLAHQVQQNNLSQHLQFLAESLSTSQTALTRLSSGLEQLKLPTSAEQIQSQIKAQIQLPGLLANLGTNPLTSNTGLATQLLQALQILFKAKTSSRQSAVPNASSAKSSTTGSANSAAQAPSLAQKQTQSAAQSLKHFQINQIKTAEQQSQGQNQIFASLPYMHNSHIDYAQLALQCEADEFEDEHKQAVKLWKFSLKFNLEAGGKLLIKAALVDNKLKLNIYCEAESLNQAAQAKIDELKKRLSLLNLNLEETGFNLGKIPEQLWQETAITMQYRL